MNGVLQTMSERLGWVEDRLWSLVPSTFQEAYQTFAFAVIVMAVLLIPYNFYALLYRERDPRIREIHADRGRRYWPSLFILTWLVRLNFSGTLFVIATLILGMLLQYEKIGDVAPQPAWSLMLSMLRSMILLAMISAPAVFLIWLKHEIVKNRYEQGSLTEGITNKGDHG